LDLLSRQSQVHQAAQAGCGFFHCQRLHTWEFKPIKRFPQGRSGIRIRVTLGSFSVIQGDSMNP
jgi:hypothetical protein